MVFMNTKSSVNRLRDTRTAAAAPHPSRSAGKTCDGATVWLSKAIAQPNCGLTRNSNAKTACYQQRTTGVLLFCYPQEGGGCIRFLIPPINNYLFIGGR